MARIPDRDEYRRQWAALGLKDRRRIVRAVNRGEPLDNRKEAALAVVTAEGQQRFWRRAWMLGPIASLFVLIGGQGWVVYAVNAVLLTALMAAMSFFWYRRAERAIEANRARLGARTSRDGGKDGKGKG